MKLPHSLLTLIFCSAVYTLPVNDVSELESVTLTAETFGEVVSKGTWLIEFFSPWCGHCRSFAPTWDEVVERVSAESKAKKGATLGVSLAKVNCVDSGDLCKSEAVRGYPTLRIYENGESGEEFKGDRSFSSIIQFIGKHAGPLAKLDQGENSETAEDAPAFHVQDERTDIAINPNGEVLSLDPSNFDKVVQSVPTFVKFFAPWCGHCKKLAPTWTELAQEQKNKLTIAEVNCDSYSSLCKQQDVQGYPMIYFYKQGTKLDYTGSRTIDAMQSFTDKVMVPTVKTLPPGKEDNLHELFEDTEVVFLFIHIQPDTTALERIKEIGNRALMTPALHIYTTTSPSLRSQYASSSVGSVLVVIRHANVQSQATPSLVPESIQGGMMEIAANTPTSDILHFLDRHRLPAVTELTSENFQSVMSARFSPLVVLLPTEEDKQSSDVNILRVAEKRAQQVVSGHRDRTFKGAKNGRDVVFVYIDMHKWASWLKSMYGIKKDRRSFVIADHSKLIYYDTYKSGKHFEVSAAGLVQAVDEVLSGHLSARHSENIFQRWAHGVEQYVESFVETFVKHPFYMLLLLVAAMGTLAWIITRIVSEDIGGQGPNGRRFGEKNGRRLD